LRNKNGKKRDVMKGEDVVKSSDVKRSKVVIGK